MTVVVVFGAAEHYSGDMDWGVRGGATGSLLTGTQGWPRAGL